MGKFEVDLFNSFPLSISLEEAKISYNDIQNFLNIIIDKNLDLNSFLLLKNGRLVFEYNKYPYDSNTPRDSFSAVKALISLAVGITVDKGLLNIDEKIVDIFSEHKIKNPDNKLHQISVKHLLTSSTGHDGDALFSCPKDCNDIVKWFLELNIPHEPGKQCRYENPCYLILSHILVKRNNCSVQTLLDKYLFSKIEAKSISWLNLKQDNIPLKFRTTPLDYARVGLLLLNKGVWNGSRVISEEWIQLATLPQIEYPQGSRMNNYGFLFWCDNIGGFSATGDHGQRLIVLPEQDLVVVMTGTEPNHGLIYDYFVDFYKRIKKNIPQDYGTVDNIKILNQSSLSDNKNKLFEAALQITGKTYSFSPQEYCSPSKLGFSFLEQNIFKVIITNNDGVEGEFTGALGNIYHFSKLTPINIFTSILNNDTETEVAVRGNWKTPKIFICEIRPLRYGTVYKYQMEIKSDRIKLTCTCNRRKEILYSKELT